jgi:hypothetical protein
MINLDTLCKVRLSQKCCFFICPYGSSDTFCARLNRIPGIYHTTSEFESQLKQEYDLGMYEDVEPRYLIESKKVGCRRHPTHYNYDIRVTEILKIFDKQKIDDRFILATKSYA